MNDDKTGLKIILGILGALAVVAALWRVLAYEPDRTKTPVAAVTTRPGGSSLQRVEQTPRQEILDEFLGSTPNALATKQGRFAGNGTVENKRPLPYSQNRAAHKQPYPGRVVTGSGKRYVDTNFYTQDNKHPTAYTAQPGTSYTPGSYVGPQADFNTSAQSRMQQERAQMLAPYLRPNRKEKEQMDAKWAKLSAAIDRAVAQALTPKSKREQSIEKYTAKTNTPQTQASGFAGPYASVADAVATQKQEIVKSFGTAFGGQAARQASSLMDNYAQELAGALNLPNATPEQKAQKVKEISKKYQKEMDKLAEKSQYDKFVADRLAQDNQRKDQLRAQYSNPQLNAKFSQIIDAAREKDLALATQQLPAEEYYKAVYANQYEAHTKLEEAVRQEGESLSALRELDSKNAQKELETLRKQEEEGKIISVARKSIPEDAAGLEKTLNKEQDELLTHFSQTYGEQKAQEVKQILSDYHDQMMRTTQQELSPAERAQRQHDLWVNSNRHILQWQMDQVQQMNIPDEQKQAALAKLRQDYNNIK